MNPFMHLLPAAASNAAGTFWLPPAASSQAQNVDPLFMFIVWLCTIFFVAIIAATVWFTLRYRRRPEDGPLPLTPPVHGNAPLEIVWSVVPTILLLGLFAWGFVDWMKLNAAPADAMEIRLTGQKWSWSISYPKYGINTNELVVPVGKPVRLVMSSVDVLHSFYVPEFRVKRDVIPGRYTVLWFEATELGEFTLTCAEYCGTNHSKMRTKVIVKSPDEFAAWLKTGGLPGDASPEKLGEILFARNGCTACHNVTGTRLIGPPLNGVFGRETKLADGAVVHVDDNYLRESILVPTAKVVDGYPPVMPPFQGRLDEQQLNAVIDYLKSVK